MSSRIISSIALVAVLAFLWGCGDDKPTSSNGNLPDTSATTTTTWNSEGYWETRNLDATSYDQFTYYSFSTRDTVASGNGSWSIAFQRASIILNGGVSGSGGVMGVNLAELGHPDSTDFPAFDDLASVDSSDWVADTYELVIDEWFFYDPINHSLTLSEYVYVMKDAEENFVKFQVSGMENNGMPPDMGTITIQYIYSGSSPVFSGTPDTIVFDGSSGGPIYVDFSAGMTTTPANPENSTEWDILFVNYEVRQNNTVFGSGSAGTYEVWLDQNDPTDFNETSQAPVNAPYFPDQLGSVLTDWYNYDGQTHTLTSKNYVYVIKDGNSHYKLQIQSYYQDIGGNPVAGWYSFRWVAID